MWEENSNRRMSRKTLWEAHLNRFIVHEIVSTQQKIKILIHSYFSWEKKTKILSIHNITSCSQKDFCFCFSHSYHYECDKIAVVQLDTLFARNMDTMKTCWNVKFNSFSSYSLSTWFFPFFYLLIAQFKLYDDLKHLTIFHQIFKSLLCILWYCWAC